jgi:hypothetical protein
MIKACLTRLMYLVSTEIAIIKSLLLIYGNLWETMIKNNRYTLRHYVHPKPYLQAGFYCSQFWRKRIVINLINILICAQTSPNPLR